MIRRLPLNNFRLQLNDGYVLDDLLCLVHRNVNNLLDVLSGSVAPQRCAPRVGSAGRGSLQFALGFGGRERA